MTKDTEHILPIEHAVGCSTKLGGQNLCNCGATATRKLCEAILKRDYISREAHGEEVYLLERDLIEREYNIKALEECIGKDYISKQSLEYKLAEIRQGSKGTA